MPGTPAIPPTVAALLAWWLPRARGLCGRDFVSATLFGSVAHGDFLPRWSDVDVCLVLAGEPGDDVRAAQDRLARESVERFVVGGADGWKSGQAVEGPAISRAAAADPTDPALEPFDRLSLARAGVLLAGAPVVFAPPPADALAGSRRRRRRRSKRKSPAAAPSPTPSASPSRSAGRAAPPAPPTNSNSAASSPPLRKK